MHVNCLHRGPAQEFGLAREPGTEESEVHGPNSGPDLLGECLGWDPADPSLGLTSVGEQDVWPHSSSMVLAF